MYFYSEESKRVYTLMPSIEGKFIESAHPAKFSPDDVFSKYRITTKKRHRIFPFDV